MRPGSRLRRLFVLGALPMALWAALPAVQWCPLDWQEACIAALLQCPSSEAQAACEAGGACPLIKADPPSTAGDICGSPEACPMARAESSPRPERDPAKRTYCVGAPNGGAGLRAHGAEFRPIVDLVAIVPGAAFAQRAVALAEVVPQRTSRAPPGPWLTQPPARAPPSLRQT